MRIARSKIRSGEATTVTRAAACAVCALLVLTVNSHGPSGRASAETAATAAAAPAPQAVSRKAQRVRARVDAAFRRVQHGLASYYANYFDGRRTASGIPFDNSGMFAAHPTYPFGTVLRVTNLANGEAVTVRVIDRGPARGPQAEGVVIDLSRAAADALGFVDAGRTKVRLERMPSAATRAAARRTAAAEGR